MCMFVCEHMCRGMCVKIKGQLAGVVSVFLPYEIWEPNLGPLDWQQVVHSLNINMRNTLKKTLKTQRE